MKTLNKSQLQRLKNKGAKVAGEKDNPSSAPQVPRNSTPEVGQMKVDSAPIEKLADAATKTLESASRVESALSSGLSSAENSIRDLLATMKTDTKSPVPYDLVITRRRDGLIDKIRLQPVIS